MDNKFNIDLGKIAIIILLIILIYLIYKFNIDDYKEKQENQQYIDDAVEELNKIF